METKTRSLKAQKNALTREIKQQKAHIEVIKEVLSRPADSRGMHWLHGDIIGIWTQWREERELDTLIRQRKKLDNL